MKRNMLTRQYATSIVEPSNPYCCGQKGLALQCDTKVNCKVSF